MPGERSGSETKIRNNSFHPKTKDEIIQGPKGRRGLVPRENQDSAIYQIVDGKEVASTGPTTKIALF